MSNVNDTRAAQAGIARKINDLLGGKYNIKYDACDSGLTYCYYNNIQYKVVMNDELTGSVNLNDFVAPIELRDPMYQI